MRNHDAETFEIIVYLCISTQIGEQWESLDLLGWLMQIFTLSSG